RRGAPVAAFRARGRAEDERGPVDDLRLQVRVHEDVVDDPAALVRDPLRVVSPVPARRASAERRGFKERAREAGVEVHLEWRLARLAVEVADDDDVRVRVGGEQFAGLLNDAGRLLFAPVAAGAAALV